MKFCGTLINDKIKISKASFVNIPSKIPEMAIKLKPTLKFTQIKPYKINVYKAFLLHKISRKIISKYLLSIIIKI